MQFNRGGNPWGKEEDDQLIKEYNVDKLTILELSKLHDRTPGGIISRLIRKKIIDTRDTARGYLEYKNSAESLSQNTSKEYLIDDTETISPTSISAIESNKNVKKLLRKNIPYDLAEVKSDIKEIKEKVNKLIELLTAVYDFEQA